MASGGLVCVGLLAQVFGAGPDFAGDVTFETAHDFGFGFAFGDASGDVGAGGFVVFHPDDDDAMQSGVGAAVSAPVEAVSARFAAGGPGGGGAAKVGQRRPAVEGP